MPRVPPKAVPQPSWTPCRPTRRPSPGWRLLLPRVFVFWRSATTHINRAHVSINNNSTIDDNDNNNNDVCCGLL